jgi:outer membrane protein assembly factor BamB
VLVGIAASAIAENWPGWRGPRADGSSLETVVPTQWNGETGQNVRWKIPILAKGHSSPIVWGERVFVTGYVESQHARVLLCIDRVTGKLIWEREVLVSPPEILHPLNSYASGTPATDGQVIYVSFLENDGREEPAKNVSKPKNSSLGRMFVAAIDWDGNVLWKKFPTPFSSTHGFCTSPVIYEDFLILNGDHDGTSSILALDRRNGELVWKFPRVHETRSYCTPIIRQVAGREQMVLAGSKQVVSLDPKTGKPWWFVEGPTEQFVASMVYDGEKFYLSAGFPDYFVMAIRPDGDGDVTKTHVAWNSTEAKCYVPSPVLAAKQLFVVDDRGTINCFETKDGSRIYRDRLSSHYSASLVTANDLVYCTADDGVVRVVKAGGQELNIVAENPLGENCFSSPAISNGQLFFRGESHLFAIGQ